MDLFIINRYTDDNDDEKQKDNENLHLQRLKQKIEERRKTFTATRVQPETIVLKEQKEEESENKLEEIAQSSPDSQKRTENKTESSILSEKKETKKPAHDFKVLGSDDFEKKVQVERVLPYWLSHAFSVSKNLQKLTCCVDDLDWLHETLKSMLKSEGVTHLFPVQEKVIPFILQEHKHPEPLFPHDICVSAPTGSGKTLCFVLPIIQILMNSIGHHIRALVVLPVQELAVQVAKVFKKYSTNTGLKVALLSGSVPLQKEQQQIIRYTETMGWISEVDIIVCTAGRLVEHLQNTEGFSLKHLKFLVIDEADRIMDNIQNDWLYYLEKHITIENRTRSKIPHLNWSSLNNLKAPLHKLLFSATLSPDPELLEKWGLFQPKLFSAAPVNDRPNGKSAKKYSTPDELQEEFVVCNPEEKPLVLYHLLVELKWDKVLCFTNSAQAAHRLTVLMSSMAQDNLRVAELSSALDRTSRETVLKKFKQSEINVIISTDALARGIDIPECSYVISYDPPRNIKTYIHRVGRTGRAGRKGRAVTFLIQNQLQMFKEILEHDENSKVTQMEIQPESLQHLVESYERSIHETKMLINNEIHTKVTKSKELKRSTKPRKRKHSEGKVENSKSNN
ncbi:probable ATP-dependent RNA helicase Dbp73D [Aricia agestis]|uniref:probable ATP-dependent RNA helicase Dbp73D n=1 Tax=Aricia agestis TaxID=91739 RepID=UPI001C202D1F|nr:probable ATP-dependent RNA helicase Dbp73D [Aricia agestis]